MTQLKLWDREMFSKYPSVSLLTEALMVCEVIAEKTQISWLLESAAAQKRPFMEERCVLHCFHSASCMTSDKSGQRRKKT